VKNIVILFIFAQIFKLKEDMATRKDNAKKEDTLVDVVEVKGSTLPTESNFFEQNQKMITYVIGGLLGLLALWAAYKYLIVEPNNKEAVTEIYKAEELFAKDSFAVALTSSTGAYKGFLEIIDDYSGTKTANLAKYYAGVSYLNLGKFKEAVEYLDDYSAKDDVTSVMKAGALGDAHAELGDKAKALTYYADAADTDNELLAPYYLNKLAMLSYSEGKKEEAIKQLLVIQEKYPDSPEYREVEKLLARFQ
jgi:tetratricopeptide (TPR) repeat protein